MEGCVVRGVGSGYRCDISTLNSIVTFGGNGGTPSGGILITTRASRIKFVVAGVASSNFLHFTPINKVSTTIILNEQISVGKVGNIINTGTIRLLSSSRGGGRPTFSGLTVSVNTTSGTRTRGTISLNSYTCFTSSCYRFNSKFVGSGTLSSEVNYVLVVRLVGSSLRCSACFYFGIRRRIKLHKSNYSTCTIGPSITIVLRSAATTSVSNIANNSGYYILNGNPIISFVSNEAVCSGRVFSLTFRITGRCGVGVRAGAGVTNKGSTNTVRGDKTNYHITTISLPYECVRSNSDIIGVTSVRRAHHFLPLFLDGLCS